MIEETAISNKIYDYNIEMSILCNLLYDSKLIDEIQSEIDYRDFYDNRNKEIYKLLLKLRKEKKDFDNIIFKSFARQNDKLDIIGEEYIDSLFENIYTSQKIEIYAERLKELSTRRKLVDACQVTTTKVYNGQEESRDIIEQLEQKMTEINNRNGINNVTTVQDLLTDFLDRVSQKKKISDSVTTGYADFNNLTLGGLHPSELVILAARPGMGKTALALNMALNAAKDNKKVLLLSLEMGTDQLMDRLLSMQSNVPLKNIRGKFCNDHELMKLADAVATLTNYSSISISETTNLTIYDISQMARKLKREEDGLDLLIIDYLQLIKSTSDNRTREQQVSEISRALKTLAIELKIPIIALAQLSRGVENREGNRPKLSDIRESGSIEQDADLVLFLYRNSYYKREDQNYKSQITELSIDKNRNGSQGIVYLTFDAECQKFYDTPPDAINSYKAKIEQEKM